MSLGIYGSSTLTLDTKGRVIIPARYRELLRQSCQGEMVITKDPQYPALMIYPGKSWKEISRKFTGQLSEGACLELEDSYINISDEKNVETEDTNDLSPTHKNNFHEIKAPMIGTFYQAPEPTVEAFVKVGDPVSEGDTSQAHSCLLYTSTSPRDRLLSPMPSSA